MVQRSEAAAAAALLSRALCSQAKLSQPARGIARPSSSSSSPRACGSLRPARSLALSPAGGTSAAGRLHCGQARRSGRGAAAAAWPVIIPGESGAAAAAAICLRCGCHAQRPWLAGLGRVGGVGDGRGSVSFPEEGQRRWSIAALRGWGGGASVWGPFPIQGPFLPSFLFYFFQTPPDACMYVCVCV